MDGRRKREAKRARKEKEAAGTEDAVLVVLDPYENVDDLPSVEDAWAAARVEAAEIEIASADTVPASSWEEFERAQSLENARKRALNEDPAGRAAKAKKAKDEKDWAKRVAEEEKRRVPLNEGVLRRAVMRVGRDVHAGLVSRTLPSWRLEEFLRQQRMPQHRRPPLSVSPLLFGYGRSTFMSAEDEQRVLVILDKVVRDPSLAPLIPGVNRREYENQYQVDVLGPEVLNRLPRELGLTSLTAEEVDVHRKTHLSFRVEQELRAWKQRFPSPEPLKDDDAPL